MVTLGLITCHNLRVFTHLSSLDHLASYNYGRLHPAAHQPESAKALTSQNTLTLTTILDLVIPGEV